MEQTYIYLLFSSTPYRIGSMIRKITKGGYNHTSIALDGEFEQIYSFARRYYRTPFIGGFVRESVSRYHPNGQDTEIKMCKIPVTQEQYHEISRYIATLYADRQRYLYNHLTTVSYLFSRRIPVKDAFVCVEFCAKILSMAGLDIDPNRYISMAQLEKRMESYVVYTGPLPPAKELDTEFFAKRPVKAPFLRSARDILALIPRIGK